MSFSPLKSKCSSLSSHQSLMAETNERDNKSASTGVGEKEAKSPNFVERAKEEIQAMFHHDKAHSHDKEPHGTGGEIHDKETHGTSDDIDESTRVDEVKGPNVFERVKEEVEAVVGAIHPKK